MPSKTKEQHNRYCNNHYHSHPELKAYYREKQKLYYWRKILKQHTNEDISQLTVEEIKEVLKRVNPKT